MRNKFLQERIEAQERKIAALELSKKVGSGGSESKLLKKIEEIQTKEKDCQKQKLKLEEENMNLKYKLEQNQINHPKIIKHVQELNVFINNLRDTNEEVLALELKSLCEELAEGQLMTNQPKEQVKSSPKKAKQLTDEITKLKVMNEELIVKLEGKNREMDELRAAKPAPVRAVASAVAPSSGQMRRDEETTYAVPNMEEIRKLEADLKRKSDLLTEVKILLKQAADRERSILNSKEELSHKLKLILEVDPKSPSEALAKELRQARLTIDRLQNETKELEHKITLLENSE